jgi:Tol biopolymer transport system component
MSRVGRSSKKIRRAIPAALWLLLAATGPAVRAQEEKPASKPGLPLQPGRKIAFTTDEGTWISLDVSPDGQTIVFELLGQLWTLPIQGGQARRITTGMAFNRQPRFSPDGRWLVFISDRDGADNLWIAHPDGSEPRQITHDRHAAFASPAWTPDGNSIVVSRAADDLSAYELWLYDIRGGSGIALTHAKARPETPRNEQDNALGPAVSPDGRYIYFAHKRGGFQYNILNFPLWQIQRLDRHTGTVETLTAAEGSAFRPWISPNGRWLVYGTRYEADAALRLRDLHSGEERWLRYPIQRDDQESRFVEDLLPGYAFTPDSQALVYFTGGKIHRLELTSGQDRIIPFVANVELELGPSLDRAERLEQGPIRVRLIQQPVESPDGRRLAFSALTHLYVMDLPSGAPRRLTPASQRQFEPAWSPDGQWLAYVTWQGERGGVWKIQADGQGEPVKLSTTESFYSEPVWSPDGRGIVALRMPASLRRWGSTEAGPPPGTDVVWIAADGTGERVIVPAGGAAHPHFGPEADRIYLSSAEGLFSVKLDGTDRRVHLKVQGNRPAGEPEPAREIQISPQGRLALALVRNQLYLVAVPEVGAEVPTVNVDKPTVASKKLTDIGADSFAWSQGGRVITWGLGASFFREPVERVSFADPTKPQPASAFEEVPVTLEVPRYTPHGTLVLRGARIVTMRGDEVIERGDLVIRDNRIAAVGPQGSVPIPAGARVLDVRGTTIIPGLIDVHAHWTELRRSVLDTESWPFLANLAYGVTTGRDPQSFTNDVFAYADLIEAGEMLGPRVFSTGPGVFSDNDFQSYEQTRDFVLRYARYYRTKTLKSYMVGNRQQRQWMVQACKELGIMPTTEGGLDMPLDLTHAIDGFSGNEHSIPIVPLYRDVIELLARSGIHYTPTLIVAYGGPWAENYYYETTDVHGDAKLNRFVPHSVLDQRAKRRPWFLPQEQVFPRLAAQDARLLRAGGRVQLGCHGQLQGIGCHWELWALASGGMSPLEALRAATLYGAEAIGYAQDLGSIEPGKLADLVVLNKNPLEDIHNTLAIRYVMKNGVLYDGNTLDELWPEVKKLPPQPWWNEGPAAAAASSQ